MPTLAELIPVNALSRGTTKEKLGEKLTTLTKLKINELFATFTTEQANAIKRELANLWQELAPQRSSFPKKYYGIAGSPDAASAYTLLKRKEGLDNEGKQNHLFVISQEYILENMPSIISFADENFTENATIFIEYFLLYLAMQQDFTIVHDLKLFKDLPELNDLFFLLIQENFFAEQLQCLIIANQNINYKILQFPKYPIIHFYWQEENNPPEQFACFYNDRYWIVPNTDQYLTKFKDALVASCQLSTADQAAYNIILEQAKENDIALQMVRQYGSYPPLNIDDPARIVTTYFNLKAQKEGIREVFNRAAEYNSSTAPRVFI